MGDVNGDGRPDIVSGSNCCAPGTVHLLLRRADGSFAERRDLHFERPGLDPAFALLARGTTRPHLWDWDRDGRTDLVIGYVGGKTFYVGAGPLGDEAEVVVTPVVLPVPPGMNPVHFALADWDRDGAPDLIAASQFREKSDDPWGDGIFWFRNMRSAEGAPVLAAPGQLLRIPEPWDLHAFTIADGGDGRCSDLVVSVSRDWKREAGKGWTAVSQLWRYRRRD